MRLSQNDDHPCNPPHPSIRYHHNAYFVQQAGVVVRQQDLGKFVEFVELIFANQDSGYQLLFAFALAITLITPT